MSRPLVTPPPPIPALVVRASDATPTRFLAFLLGGANPYDGHHARKRKLRIAHHVPRAPVPPLRLVEFPRTSTSEARAYLRPVARFDGEDALGVSLRKSKRWRVLGGHGRNGAG